MTMRTRSESVRKRLAITLLAMTAITGCSDPEVLETPQNELINITLAGKITQGHNYALAVRYVATNNVSHCREWALFAGDQPSLAARRYYPEIKGDQHVITLPVNAISSASDCGWQILDIRFCGGVDQGNCYEFLDLSRPNRTTNHYPVVDPDQPLEVGCSPDSNVGTWYCNVAEQTQGEQVNYISQMRLQMRRGQPRQLTLNVTFAN